MAVLVMVINGYLLVDFFSSEVNGPWIGSIVCAVTAAYAAFIIYLILPSGVLSTWLGRALPKRITSTEN